MSKHTPGPWTYQVDDGKSTIATVAHVGEFRVGVDCKTPHDVNYEWHADCEVDARLIAAAPDLLEALRRMLNGSEYVSLQGEPPDWHSIAMPRKDALERARIAILKATGEQQ